MVNGAAGGSWQALAPTYRFGIPLFLIKYSPLSILGVERAAGHLVKHSDFAFSGELNILSSHFDPSANYDVR